MIKCLASSIGDNYALYHGDTVAVLPQIPDNSIDMHLYSPPFSNVYTYSDHVRDMGNVTNDEQFGEAYAFLVKELYRTLRPGRICAVHCKDLVYYRTQRGTAGLRDFPGDLIRMHTAAGFDLHSKVTIWKCPVTEMQRTKAHGLLYSQLRRDSTFSRQGCAEYLMIFRKWAGEEDDGVVPVTHSLESGGVNHIELDQWQEWASPVWMTVDQTNVLNVQQARDDKDEKHMCPLQLDVIERAVKLWTNPGEVVLSPFAGVGSEGVGALTYGRKFVGVELKDSYFHHAIRNLDEIDRPRQSGMFSGLTAK